MARARDDSLPADLRIDPRGGFRSLGAAASKLAAGLADRRGWTAARLIAHWPEIVGVELSRRSLPERLVAQGRLAEARSRFVAKDDKPVAPPQRPAALRIRVAGAAALEIQHRETEIIERVNGYLGYRAVDRLQLVQGALPIPLARRSLPPLDVARVQAIASKVAPIRDGDLRAALERLGQTIARQK